MSLTMSFPFTILTYDPPSTPISYIGLNKNLPDPRDHNQQYPSAISHKSTPPKESKGSSGAERPDKTPSARAKVLPWVQGVDIEEEPVPDGMFGPYPSRPQWFAEPGLPTSQSRHPFAYSNVPTLPFAALGTGNRNLQEEQATEMRRSYRPESEAFSRNAGMKAMAQPVHATAAGAGADIDTPGGMSSIGMGTFGLEGQSALGPAGIPLPKSRYTAATGSPKKTQYTTRKAPPSAPLPPDPPQTKPDSDEQVDQQQQAQVQANLHKPHHEFAFSHAEAQAKQLQAMEEARSAALAQLEAAQRNSAIEMEQEMLAVLENHMQQGQGEKGPRGTYDTLDSGPSFGHLLHQNGFPLSARPSTQNPPENANFFRVPFGVPLGMNVPRPLLVMRDSAGAGLGLGLNPDLLEILEQDQGINPRGRGRGPEDRSAFVETVEDEETSGIRSDTRTGSPPKTPSQSGRSVQQPAQAAARTESVLLDQHTNAPRSSAQTPAAKSAKAPTERIKSPSVAPKTPSTAPLKVKSKSPSKAPTVMSQAFPKAPSITPTTKTTKTNKTGNPQVPRVVSQNTFMEYPDGQTIYSQVRTKNTPTIIPNSVHEYHHDQEDDGIRDGNEAQEEGGYEPSHHDSVAPTTISNVKQLVAESKFHDETLCQLLDAARLNLIGDAAKKALQRAARARVIELRDLRERGEIEEGIIPSIVPEEPRSNQSTPKKEKRSKSKERSRKKSTSDKTETVVAVQDPPAWAQDIMGRLAAFDARFSALEHQKQEVEHMGRPTTEYSQVTQDIPGNLIDELMFNEMPSSGFTHGIHMPQGLTQSIVFPEQAPMPTMPGQPATHYSHKPVSTYPAARTGYAPTQLPQVNGTAHSHYAPTNYTYNAPSQARSAHPTQAPTNVNPADIPTWGSEVEMPQAGDNNVQPLAPTINVLAPTESGLGPNGRPSTRAPSPSVRSRNVSRAGTHHTGPDHVEVTVITEQPLQDMPNGTARPPTTVPAQSEQSYRPTPPSKSTVLGGDNMNYTGRGGNNGQDRSQVNGEQFQAQSAYIGSPDQYPPTLSKPVPSSQVAPTTTVNPQMSDIHMQPHNIMMSPPKNPGAPPRRDMIHIIDPLLPSMGGWKPWDMLTQRLYSWALIAEEKSFVRALEEVSLGRQVEEFPLSIFLMMTYKRLIRRNLSENPPIPCDKLFVPPNIANAINIAVHARRYHDAKEILLELWNSLGSNEPPRVIIALAPLGNDPDQWASHRYDLVTRHLTSYRVSHLDQIQTDGRSFWWWEAIGQAWPQLQIPDMETLEQSGRQRIINERRPPEHRHDNSLYAANISRNLLLGYRPERQQDLTKLRELVWAEVKRLLGKKRHGKLVVEPESPEHLYDA
ncbi:uncharacterized protein L201_006030 [Kwoniella dendrophila CBS 6074]|uniref:Uncharacterized protein n=1 Tax=Kwoniella dendrophila CBS 6074 TaxID=1295534 RepID=A0AAX4K1V6_9TREE